MASIKEARSIYDAIEILIAYEKCPAPTKERFKYIRNHGTEEELQEAVEQMLAAGGYDALADE